MTMLGVSWLPYMELAGRVKVGSEGGRLVCGRLVSIGCFCMVAAEIIEVGDVESWITLAFERIEMRTSENFELVVRCCAHRHQGKCATDSLFVIEYGDVG